jgi:iron complex outermembrane receptor protein
MTQMFSSASARPGDPVFRINRISAGARWRRLAAVSIFSVAALIPAALFAQTPAAAQSQSATPEDDPALRFQVPTVTVTAQKEPEDRQKIPVSVTAVPRDTLENAGVQTVSDAAIYAPNVYFTEWTARKLSNARFRGISSSPNNPGITTYIDGVPQLNANSSSIELLDVEQIEFARGPQSALYGRNTLGGLVNITSIRPSLTKWTGAASVPFGDYGSWALRAAASGPLVSDKLSVGLSVAQVSRDGFTINDVTGHDLDNRSAFSAKAQMRWTPNRTWEARVIFTGERARDGDYSLNDVAALRANPFHASRDFEGAADRDVIGTTIQTRRTGSAINFSSTTGFVNWKTQDVTDLDYTARPLVTRNNSEKDFQFTQEVRFASADSAAIRLSDRTRLRWQAGASLFTQAYKQDAINTYAPFLIAPFALSEHTPQSALDDVGVGVFGQGTVSFSDRLELTVGARVDYEDKSATLETFYDPAIAPGTSVDADKSFSNVSPEVALAYRLRPDKTLYAAVGRGYKAGGFNSASPTGSDAYGEEKASHFEAGAKTLWANGRVSANAAVFYIDWTDLQLNVPNPAVPAQFYITNVGGAVSKGVEAEINARVAPGIDLFTALGYTHARFSTGSVSSGVNVAGNDIPNTPDYTASAGVQYSRSIGAMRVHGRADVVFYGAFQYNDQNSLSQDAYSLVNFRAGVTRGFVVGELFMRNAFDTRYIPLAFPYPNLAPSGFVGEMGAPRTFGINLGVRF